MAESWRWIDGEDGRHMLVEGAELLPVSRVVLECGNVDAADQDRIAAVPQLIAACEKFQQLDENMHVTEADWSGFRRELAAALAKARGEVANG